VAGAGAVGWRSSSRAYISPHGDCAVHLVLLIAASGLVYELIAARCESCSATASFIPRPSSAATCCHGHRELAVAILDRALVSPSRIELMVGLVGGFSSASVFRFSVSGGFRFLL